MNDEFWMNRALELAKKGYGHTGTNPPVGSVIVKEGREISSGYHKKQGGLHAEAEAIKNAGEDLNGATIYVTLEPCCHYGRTPPCTKGIIEAGISKVVVAISDPDPRVAGKGLNFLKKAGIETVTGILEEKAGELYRDYFFTKARQRPKVLIKAATTLDGKIATVTGDSKWITNEASRNDGHGYRGRADGILAGIGTVLADDPMLTNRSGEGGQPVRIIADSTLRTPLTSRLVKTAKEYGTVILTGVTEEERYLPYREQEVRIISVPLKEGHLDLHVALKRLYEEGIGSLLAEGGGTLNGALVAEGLADEFVFYISPKIVGGRDAKTGIEGPGIPYLEDALTLKELKTECLDGDIKITGRVSCSQD